MRFLITGAAGFIGFHLSRRLLAQGFDVDGFDGMTPYYDVKLKQARWAELERFSRFRGRIAMLEDFAALAAFADPKPDVVVHLAAQAGVRYSLENPRAYVDANLVGAFNVLEVARGVGHLLIASTSSVYGANAAMPFRETDRTDHPLTLYAATKKAGEDMAHAYAHLWKTPTTAFRFFTVYGPWGRPDMALFLFTKNILAGKPIDVFNHGHHKRDFTYVEDIVSGIVSALDHLAAANPAWDGDRPDPATSQAPYRLYNIGNNRPIELMRYIALVEECLGKKAIMNMLPLQVGDVPATWADIDDLKRDVGYEPATPVEEGIARFVRWYLEYYGGR